MQCQFAENEGPFRRHLPTSLEASEPGRGLFCYESLEAATDRRRVWADSGWHGCTHLFYHLPAKIVWVGGKAFLPGLAFTEF
jgi:hypothetical protein